MVLQTPYIIKLIFNLDIIVCNKLYMRFVLIQTFFLSNTISTAAAQIQSTVQNITKLLLFEI